MNKVFLTGRLGRDVEVRHTNGGMAVGNVSIATDEREKVNGEWEKATEWHNLVLWGKTAENAALYVGKGSKVAVFGRLKTREWSDKDGGKRKATEIVVDQLEFLDAPGARQRDVKQDAMFRDKPVGGEAPAGSGARRGAI